MRTRVRLAVTEPDLLLAISDKSGKSSGAPPVYRGGNGLRGDLGVSQCTKSSTEPESSTKTCSPLRSRVTSLTDVIPGVGVTCGKPRLRTQRRPGGASRHSVDRAERRGTVPTGRSVEAQRRPGG